LSHAESHSWRIRSAESEKAESVLVLWRQAGATVSATDTVADIRRAISNSSALVLVAEINGRLIGSIIGTFDGWRGHVYRLAVHPDFRRQGMASALLRELESWFAQVGAKRIIPLVEKEHPDAMGFWHAAGYMLDPRIVRFFRNLG
jgi:ribosomal protein S18 acetylase RimI-like enzyme